MFALNGNGKKILKKLMTCALTEYESKTYFTLLVSGKSRAYDLSIRSSVPQSKIYYAVEELRRKGLAYTVGWKPKIVYPLEFQKYLNKMIRQKQKEIKTLEKIGNEINDSAQALNSFSSKLRSRHKVFEPNYRRSLVR